MPKLPGETALPPAVLRARVPRATPLAGDNPTNLLFTWLGAGGNGKGVLQDWLLAAFGGYATTWDGAMLTADARSRDAPAPTLLRVAGKRVVFVSEPKSGGGELNVDWLKKLSGGDRLEGRALHSNDVRSLVMTAKLVVLANELAVDSSDVALARRLVHVPFPFNFVGAPAKPNERAADAGLKREVTSPPLRDALMDLLLAT